MVNTAALFIKAIKAGDSPYWLSLLGSSGAGKTYLARKVWSWFQKSSFNKTTVDEETRQFTYGGQFCFWPGFVGELLGNTGYGRLDDLASERFVVLDEIGADRDPSGHARDCLARLLSQRVGKWTLITSNKSLGDIQRDIDTRISSRMVRDGSVVVDVEVRDFALR
jgi:DNA replication protein DnaC